MFVLKKKYFFIIENIKDIDLSNVKLFKKVIIIYRNKNNTENYSKLLEFRKNCRSKKIKFYITNNVKLMRKIKADGLYISAHNKDLSLNRLKNTSYNIIGSAHNIKEINLKLLQGCSSILFSRLFKTIYKGKKDYLDVIKFNLFTLNKKENLIPLGGIRVSNLNKLNIVNCNSFALLSEIKKKPAKIFSRLF